jgi:hypothetical protein
MRLLGKVIPSPFLTQALRIVYIFSARFSFTNLRDSRGSQNYPYISGDVFCTFHPNVQ